MGNGRKKIKKDTEKELNIGDIESQTGNGLDKELVQDWDLVEH